MRTDSHVLIGACPGNREQARWFLRVARAQTGTAIDQPSSPGGTRLQGHAEDAVGSTYVTALKGSRYRVLDERTGTMHWPLPSVG